MVGLRETWGGRIKNGMSIEGEGEGRSSVRWLLIFWSWASRWMVVLLFEDSERV